MATVQVPRRYRIEFTLHETMPWVVFDRRAAADIARFADIGEAGKYVAWLNLEDLDELADAVAAHDPGDGSIVVPVFADSE